MHEIAKLRRKYTVISGCHPHLTLPSLPLLFVLTASNSPLSITSITLTVANLHRDLSAEPFNPSLPQSCLYYTRGLDMSVQLLSLPTLQSQLVTFSRSAHFHPFVCIQLNPSTQSHAANRPLSQPRIIAISFTATYRSSTFAMPLPPSTFPTRRHTCSMSYINTMLDICTTLASGTPLMMYQHPYLFTHTASLPLPKQIYVASGL